MKNDNATVKIGESTTNMNLLGVKDAFHVPGILVGSKQALRPGQDVRFANEQRLLVEPSARVVRHAVVDPFLKDVTQPGTYFWVFIEPGLAQGLRHVFDIIEHPYETAIREAVQDPEEDDSCSGCYNTRDDDSSEDEPCC